MKANTKHSKLGRLAQSLEVICLVLAVMVQWDGWSRSGIRFSRSGAWAGFGGEL